MRNLCLLLLLLAPSPCTTGEKRLVPGDAFASPGDALATNVPGHKRQRHQGSPHGGVPRTLTSSVNEGNLSTSPGTGYDPGDDAAPQGVPRDSGNYHAHRAKPEEAEPQLVTRAASHSALSPPKQRLRSVDACVHDANVYVHREAVDLDEMLLRVDWVESPQAVHNLVADSERQVAQLPQASPDWVADLER
ncbi:hypothetical protein PC129_g4790 [Phytophthora cactorum]|uniref:RxLR effector protein n=1 Tax=Phytophthora cactorum TaxID=29920 RepID=A0A329SWH2_9STRA|nr:hypothetical protein PC111_g14196 [Phytophthora cactorum]KAG2846064.1 hypothetical protein PC112_g1642 [Phytophthora cactorum]KAG2867511.1 hypothetical protein PC113_g1889 [Phytophthora cactorum]KAG2931952.1 hypothetical protein PC114_g2021 [Phytophthora cactorum]KAG2936844.1 hypothetical protein PC115_g4534 [Phytophthora cactorum]